MHLCMCVRRSATMLCVCVHVDYCDVRISFSEYHKFRLQASINYFSKSVLFHLLGDAVHSCSTYSVSGLSTAASAHPSQHKQHEKSCMQTVLNAVTAGGGQGMQRAALEYGVPLDD